jgi:hypothetical protein
MIPHGHLVDRAQLNAAPLSVVQTVMNYVPLQADRTRLHDNLQRLPLLADLRGQATRAQT